MTTKEELCKIVSCAPVNEVNTLEDVCGMAQTAKIAEYLLECGVVLSEPDSEPEQSASAALTRRSVLEEATRCVCTDRNNQYGEPEDNFAVIAGLWSEYLGVHINAHHVAMMMALFKIGRIMTGVAKADSYVDACGHLACAAEIAGKQNE